MSIHSFKFLLFALLSTLILSGCAVQMDTKRLNEKIQVVVKAKPDGEFYKKISSVKSNIREFGDQKVTKDMINLETFKSIEKSLLSALRRFDLYSENGPYELQIVAGHEKFPGFGADMAVSARLTYELIVLKNKKVILQETVDTEYVARFDEAFVGVERASIAAHGAFAKNIERICEILARR